jgi:hypothetical protein
MTTTAVSFDCAIGMPVVTAVMDDRLSLEAGTERRDHSSASS